MLPPLSLYYSTTPKEPTMTTLNLNNFIMPLKSDLGENIVQHARISENAIIDFINPVTSTLDQVKITHAPYLSDDIVKVEYIIDVEGMNFGTQSPIKVDISDLDELYEWILINE
jgi:hypothetical protein